MEPRKRLVGPNKSTNLPSDFLKQVTSAITEAFKKDLKGRALYVEGRMYPAEIQLSVGFKPEPKEIRQINFEASIDHNNKQILEKMGFCLDAISSMMEQYFGADGEIDFPKSWTQFEMGKQVVYLQVSGRNTELEAKANALLGVDDSRSLYSDSSEEDEADEELEKLLDEAEEESDPKRRSH